MNKDKDSVEREIFVDLISRLRQGAQVTISKYEAQLLSELEQEHGQLEGKALLIAEKEKEYEERIRTLESDVASAQEVAENNRLKTRDIYAASIMQGLFAQNNESAHTNIVQHAFILADEAMEHRAVKS